MNKYVNKILPYTLGSIEIGQRPISVIVNGEILKGQDILSGTIGNLNRSTFELQENIKTIELNTNNINSNVNSLVDFVGDFSDDDRTFLRYKNNWVAVNNDGTQASLDYAVFSSVETRDNHIIPVTTHKGNSKPRTSSTFSMKTKGLYRVDFNGVINKSPSANPIELLCLINGTSVASLPANRVDTARTVFNGFMVFPVRDELDVIHFEVANELGITASVKGNDMNIIVDRLGDLSDE